MTSLPQMTCQKFIARNKIEKFYVFQKLCEKVVKLVKDQELSIHLFPFYSISNSTVSLQINKFRGYVDMLTYTFTLSYLHVHYVISLNTICCHPRNFNHSNN